ncbi:potassium voltage-gated channel subfamily C member 1 isoform X2 [Nematostella vectensis]|uniref:potassium voltage-gated channel subfamily C member 1 isoform X2 n=1 Tax=Nematostella vectensis TaxID=45351 RepID=UPI0020771D1C|nr:potassium voltage-gated channel subfamily C member 1 isoform X2 [Nematostella vectensis]
MRKTEVSHGIYTSPGDRRLVINVGGRRYETFQSTLASIPDTRLAWIAGRPHETPEYDTSHNEYFFDRHSAIFEDILNYYRTGKLHCPRGVCSAVFEEELSFWGIDEEQMEPCCWPEYTRQRTAIEDLRIFNGNASDASLNSENTLNNADCVLPGRKASEDRKGLRGFYRLVQPIIWRTLEEPFSSCTAKITAIISLAFILLSVLDFVMSSVPVVPYQSTPSVIEYVCGSWFTFEFILRTAFSPSLRRQFKKPMTWVDIGALLPFYLQFFIDVGDMERIKIFIMFRLLRVFRLFRFSYRLQIMALALKGSLHELGLLLLILVISVIFFSTLVFYTDGDNKRSKFQNIPKSFWWAIITLTTVGYGDDTPVSWSGRIVGSACALWGVLMITLPISIVNSNFSLYYAHAKAMLRLPKKVVKETFSPGTKRYLSYLSALNSDINFDGRFERELKVHGGLPSPSQSNIHLAVGALRMSSRKSTSLSPSRIRRMYDKPRLIRPAVRLDTLIPPPIAVTRERSDSLNTVNIGLLPPDWDGDLEMLYYTQEDKEQSEGGEGELHAFPPRLPPSGASRSNSAVEGRDGIKRQALTLWGGDESQPGRSNSAVERRDGTQRQALTVWGGDGFPPGRSNSAVEGRDGSRRNLTVWGGDGFPPGRSNSAVEGRDGSRRNLTVWGGDGFPPGRSNSYAERRDGSRRNLTVLGGDGSPPGRSNSYVERRDGSRRNLTVWDGDGFTTDRSNSNVEGGEGTKHELTFLGREWFSSGRKLRSMSSETQC